MSAVFTVTRSLIKDFSDRRQTDSTGKVNIYRRDDEARIALYRGANFFSVYLPIVTVASVMVWSTPLIRVSSKCIDERPASSTMGFFIAKYIVIDNPSKTELT
ncbi:uncharacterized protein BT62DRAFT_1012518 [Guyanagaster necrorhizus]|uniref:Uncharacterized protein n=1 Tax=Guyanagaster necrorhizus TaxID=856835 RepID=A0A9P7VHD7_9AGAR|nr:uncharacterized protein BT62DRAFT_1012518 [Guyanagaster necrorhizus MCA 3950]KAG7440592.1 hypothetical protein BT62DRAFT_1012518 [Guyanagaster necrorhizus MCA 3950]